MPSQTEKTHLLDEAGYVYNFDRMMYINRLAKKAFSREYIDDHAESVIASDIQESNDSGDWRFYANALTEGVERELRKVLQ
jgi:hypothetical protein